MADTFSGLTVALALVPEAIAFAFVADVSPIIGLYGAFMMGLVTSLLGGRPGMISGATGAMAIVIVGLIKNMKTEGLEMATKAGITESSAVTQFVDDYAFQYLFMAIIFAGIIQIAAGVFKLGKFVRMIPAPVMLGFVNGLAIVIFTSQLGMFKDQDKNWLESGTIFTMLALVGLTMFIMFILPKVNKKIPAGLVAIVTVTLIVIFGGVETETVSSYLSARGTESIAAGLPSFSIPSIAWDKETILMILPYSFILAAVGLIESLMTLNLIDEITETRGNANKESIGQGIANIVNGFFGGMGGCAMIGQSIINIKSGGRGRLSGLVASVALLLFILFGSTYIEMMPIAALVGVMFMVVIGTFAWKTFKIMNKIPLSDAIVIVLVTAITVKFDNLAVAVFAGVIVSALVFAWENAKRIRAKKHVDEKGVKHYEIYGPLFFGATTQFESKFDIHSDPKEVVIDFKESRVMDQSAIESINKIADKYMAVGKNIHLRHLSADCTNLIKKAEKICEVNILEDPDYFVAIDNYNKKLAENPPKRKEVALH